MLPCLFDRFLGNPKFGVPKPVFGGKIFGEWDGFDMAEEIGKTVDEITQDPVKGPPQAYNRSLALFVSFLNKLKP